MGPQVSQRPPQTVVIVPVSDPAQLSRVMPDFSTGADAQAVLDHFFARRSNPNTLAAYEADLGALAKYLSTDIRGVVGILLHCKRGQANALAVRWLSDMGASGNLSSATRARRLSTLRALTNAMLQAGAIDWEIKVDRPKVERLRDTAGPSEDSIHRLFETCDGSSEGLRNRVILALLLVLGLRRFEIVTLDVGHYDRDGRRLNVSKKGSEERDWISLPDEVTGAIDRWLSTRELGHESDGPLVCSLVPKQLRRREKSERISRRGLDEIVHQIGERAGVRVWPHALRHAAGTISLAHNHDLLEVQGLMRHENLQTTIIYDDNQKKRGSKAARDLSQRFLKPLSPEDRERELHRLESLMEEYKKRSDEPVPPPPGYAPLRAPKLADIFDFGERFGDSSWTNLQMLDDLLVLESISLERHELPVLPTSVTDVQLQRFSGRSREHKELCLRSAMWLAACGHEVGADCAYIAGRCDVHARDLSIYVECGRTRSSKILHVLDHTNSQVAVVPYFEEPAAIYVFKKKSGLAQPLLVGVERKPFCSDDYFFFSHRSGESAAKGLL
jgi:site-specific recombinase XerD